MSATQALGTAKGWAEDAVSINARRGREAAQEYNPDQSLVERARHAQTVITVVVLGVVSMVGILIFSQIEDAMPAMSTNESDEDYHTLASTQDSVVDGLGNALEFVPIIMLVLLAAVVIAVVQRMRA